MHPTEISYAELHCKTNFTFLEGAAHADELVPTAKALGYHALAITDRETLAGVVRAHGAAKDEQLKLIIGAEIHPRDAAPVLLWATDRASYARLSRMLTLGRRRAAKGECDLSLADVADHSEGLLAGVLPLTGRQNVSLEESPRQATWQQLLPTSEQMLAELRQYRELFHRRVWLVAELAYGVDDANHLAQLARWSRDANMPLVAAGNVHYHLPRRQPLHEVLTATRLHTTVDRLGEHRFPNASLHLRTRDEIRTLFAAMPQAIVATREIADRCHFSLSELRYEYPQELVPRGISAADHLAALTWQGARQRYGETIPAKVHQLIEHELSLISDLQYESYFLTVWDLVRFARSRDILCQGRGSAANSAVCFCLGVTSVDPDRCDVLFERFISRERNEAPDIDVDFEHERREEVLQYMYEKYGRERAGMTAVVITYRARSAIREVGKALGLSLDRVDAVAKHVEGREIVRTDRPLKIDPHERPTMEPVVDSASDLANSSVPPHKRPSPEKLLQRFTEAGVDPNSEIGRRLVYLTSELIGFPRHLSQHVGGMVITRGPLCELAPIENAAMEGRTVIQWDKDDLDELGILKVDCLSLGMLSAIRRCFAMIEKHYARPLTLATVPAEDPQTYEMICRADTVGVFQIESRAQMSMLPRLLPKCFYDLVIEVAIVRPGPIQGQMVHPYLRRRRGEEVPEYPSEAIREVLHKTLGVPLFQEQAMKLAVVAAGFTPGEADQLRRAMGAWRRPGIIDQFHKKLIEGMLSRGLDAEFAERVFLQIRGFGEYGFPESHAASFALLVYVSAWLKCYYPAAFAASIINSQPMGFYAPAQLIRDACEHQVTIRPIDVNHSDWDCTLEPLATKSTDPSGTTALRLGLRLISGLGEAPAQVVVQERARGAFRSLDEFARRTRLPQPVIETLSEADAFRSLSLDRRQALWQSLAVEKRPAHRPLLSDLDDDEPSPQSLPELSMVEQVFADYRTTGLSLKGHPMHFFRKQLDQLRVQPAGRFKSLPNGRMLRVAGMVLLRQRPGTAKGITFVTLEDETGIANLVIRHAIWEQHYAVARTSGVWIAHGRLQKADDVIHVLVDRIEDLSKSLAGLTTKSRDFR